MKTLHKILEASTQGFSGIKLKLTLQGLRRNNKHVPQQAAPITPTILQNMYNNLNFEIEKDRVFWAVILLSFFLLFRKSNLVPDKKFGFNPDRQLTWSDVNFQEGQVTVTIRWTKTNQYRDEVLTFPLKEMRGSQLCPVKALAQIKPMVCDGRAHCFKLADGSSFTYAQYNKKLKELIKLQGRDPAAFSSHSARHGGCTWAFLSGVPSELIQTLGNWSSDCYKRYIHFPLESRMVACDLMRLRLKLTGF